MADVSIFFEYFFENYQWEVIYACDVNRIRQVKGLALIELLISVAHHIEPTAVLESL